MTNNEGGFTILETMIVMVVSAAMLVSAIVLFSGEQRKTQFSQSLRDVESKVQDVMNDTETGYFPNIGGTTCNVGSGEPVIGAGGAEQGANFDCIFLGKTIHFQEDRLIAYPIVGLKTIDVATTTDIVSSASPVAAFTLAEESNYLWGLKLYGIYFGTNVASQLSNGALITIATSPNGTGFIGTNINSGTQRINSYVSGLGGSDTVSYTAGGTATINGSLKTIAANSWPQPPNTSAVILCFEDATGGIGRKFGGIVVAGGIQGISTRLQVDTTGGDGFVCV